MQYDMTAYEWFPTFFSSTFLNKGLGYVNILLVLLFLRSARVVLASSGDEWKIWSRERECKDREMFTLLDR